MPNRARKAAAKKAVAESMMPDKRGEMDETAATPEGTLADAGAGADMSSQAANVLTQMATVAGQMVQAFPQVADDLQKLQADIQNIISKLGAGATAAPETAAPPTTVTGTAGGTAAGVATAPVQASGVPNV